MGCSLPGFSVHGISQARLLEWIAISFSRGYSCPGIEPTFYALTGRFFTTEPPGESLILMIVNSFRANIIVTSGQSLCDPQEGL